MKAFNTFIAGLVAVTVGAGVASAAPLLQYQYEEGVGVATADNGTGAPAPGTLVGAGWTTNTPAGQSAAAADTSGADGSNLKYITGGDVDKIDGLSQFTLTQWLNFQADPIGNDRIMSKQTGAPSFDGFSWNISDPGDESTRSASAFGMRMFVGGSSGFAGDPLPNSTDTPNLVVDADNKWAFVAVTYDGTSTTNNTNYYAGSVNGSVSLLATTTINAGTLNSSTAAFNIGHTDAAAGSDTSLPGFIDDSRVYGSVLSLGELELVRLENVPEPASVALLGIALLAAVGGFRRR